MKKDLPISKVRKFLSSQSNLNVMRIYYCYQIGSTFVTLSLTESTIVHAMAMCDRIKLSKVLQAGAPAFEHIVQRHSQLQSSTLGNLLAILSKHGVEADDIAYLKWLKQKRDFFIHRFFHEEPWPGDLAHEEIRMFCRRLLYLEHVFRRARNRVWTILARAGLMERIDLGEDGAVLMNAGAEPWLTELAVAAVRDRTDNQRRGSRTRSRHSERREARTGNS